MTPTRSPARLRSASAPSSAATPPPAIRTSNGADGAGSVVMRRSLAFPLSLTGYPVAQPPCTTRCSLRTRLSSAAPERPRAADEPTFDEELLLWLGDEPPDVRAADAQRIREIAAEFAMGFRTLGRIGPAVTVFGSARTPRRAPALRADPRRRRGPRPRRLRGHHRRRRRPDGSGQPRRPRRRRAVDRLQHRASARAAARTPISTSRCASATSSRGR